LCRIKSEEEGKEGICMNVKSVSPFYSGIRCGKLRRRREKKPVGDKPEDV
jgi:hypothetical protein